MKTALYFPHLSIPSVRSAYASLPLLAGYIREKTGHSVIAKDVNVDLANKLMEVGRRRGLGCRKTFSGTLVDMARKWVLQEKRGTLSRAVPVLMSEGLRMALHKNDPDIVNYSVNLKYDELNGMIDDDRNDPLIELLDADYFKDITNDVRPVVGLSVAYFTQFQPAVLLAKFIKKINPNAFVVMGGAVIRHISRKLTGVSSLFNVVDCFVEKEGEEVLVDLITALSGDKDWRETRGIIFMDSGGQVKKNEPAVFDINNAGPPDYSMLNTHNYQESGLVYLRASTGCYYNKCAFCVLSLNRYQERGIDKVMADISAIKRTCADLRAIEFVDNSIHYKRLEQIADGLIKKGFDISWYASTRFDKGGFDESLCRKLKQSGCVSLNIGLESGCQRVNDLMNKGVKIDDAERALKNLAKYGVKCSVNVIIGFPGETEKEARQTIGFLHSNWWRIANAYISLFGLNYGSDVYANPEKYDVTYIEDDKGCLLKTSYAFHAEDMLSQEKLQELKALYRVPEWQINMKRIYKLFTGIGTKMRNGILAGGSC